MKMQDGLQHVQVAPKAELVHSYNALSNLFAGYRMLGVQMPTRGKVAYVFYSLVLNGLCTVCLPLSFAISVFINTKKELLTTGQASLNLWACVLKFVVMATKLSKLRSTKEILEKLDKRCNDLQQQAELRQMITTGNRLVVLFVCVYWTYTSSAFMGSLITGRPTYALYIPFIDWRQSRAEFMLTCCIELAGINVSCVMQTLDDAYGVIYIWILRTHFRFLRQRIERLANNIKMTGDDNLEELKRCIIDHKNLLELYDIIAPIISITIFIQFTVTASIIGITFLNIFTLDTDLFSKVSCFFYIIAVVLEILPLCFYAQYLSDESNHLADVIFHANWVDQDRRFRQMLVLFIQRTQRKMEFSAGKLFPINFATFLSIVKFSFTLYTFIKEMGVKDKYAN